MSQVVSGILSMLANGVDLPTVGARELADHAKAEWVMEPRSYRPDSQEAAEAAEVEQRNQRGAAIAFRRMPPDHQAIVLEAATLLGGPRAAKTLRATLDDHRPLLAGSVVRSHRSCHPIT